MKFINKLIIVLFVLGFAACDNLDLNLQDNPNAVRPENASLNDLYNNIQLSFADAFFSAQLNTGRAARMYHAGGGTYEDFAPAETFDPLWAEAYSNLFPDIEALLAIAEPSGFDIHAGTAKIMKAYTLLNLVDILGNVPNSQALLGTDEISPSADSGSDVYTSAIGLLDDAIGQLSGTTASGPAYEGFYGGNVSKWVKFANTIKFRAALNTKDASAIGALTGSVISSSDDDFAFQFGNQRTNPPSRHWMYASDVDIDGFQDADGHGHYEAIDGDYLSNYFMWLLNGDKVNAEGVPIADPRSRYYFYRKIEDAGVQDQTTYSCHFSVFPDQSFKPSHWESTSPDIPYCIIPNTGYSGRDHLNPDGIPPDGPIRTSYGLYPGGGQFDENSFTDTRLAGTTGGLGAGIHPIMLSSMVDLMRAEAAMTLGTGEDARMLLESGIRASMAKVVSFETLVSATIMEQRTDRTGNTSSVKDLFGATDARIDSYTNAVLELFDAGSDDDKLDLITKEQMIASWGNGLEAYNMYRRTGKPNNMQPALEPSFGDFPRTFFLPAIHVTRNANASQKAFTDRVFWDDGSIDLY